MNKQALAFLTMFSLILMLSVYYVTLPPDSISVMEETDGSKEETNISDEQEKEEDTRMSRLILISCRKKSIRKKKKSC